MNEWASGGKEVAPSAVPHSASQGGAARAHRTPAASTGRPRSRPAGGAPAAPHRRRGPRARRARFAAGGLLRRGAGNADCRPSMRATQSLCERARRAQRPRAHAERRAEIHDRLRVVGDALARACSSSASAQSVVSTRARRASRRCRSSARARASRCRRGSDAARRARARGSRRRSSGRCPAAPRRASMRRGNSPPCSATISCAARCRLRARA